MSTILQNETTAGGDLDASKVVALSVANVPYSIYLPDLDSDYIQGKIATTQAPYELEMLDDIRSRLSAGDRVLDVGANIGNHTLYMASVTGCHVVAFEPNVELADALAHSVQLNALGAQVAIKTIGLGRETAHGSFKEQLSSNLGAQSIEVGQGHITIRALDELDLQRPVKLMKIDVEGMELAVLEGGVGLIAQDRPLIYVECMTVDEFKVIEKWMVTQKYTYWDTFNSTPTHLFIPQEQASLDQRLERFQRKEVIESYQVRQQLEPLRASLASANQKYRDACQRIDVLKVQISQSDSASKALDQRLVESQRLLAAARAEVEREQQRFAEHQNAYCLKLESLISGIHAVAEPEWQAQITEVKRALESERARCTLLEQGLAEREQVCARQKAELQQMDERAALLRQAYDALSEELEAIKLQCEEHVSSRQAADLVMAAMREQNQETQRQLESTQGALDSERKVFIEHVTQLNQLLAKKADSLQEKEQRILALRGDIARANEKHDVLTQEHRSAAVHLDTVMQQLEHEQAAKKALETLLQATEAQSQEQQAFLSQALAAGAEATALQSANESLEAALKKALQDHQDLHHEQAQQHRNELDDLCEQHRSQVEQQVLQHRGELDRLGERLGLELSTQVQKHQAELGNLRDQRAGEVAELRSAVEQQQSRVEQLATELRREAERRHLAEQRLIKTRASLTYQLGYRIKSGTTSFNGLVRLPGSLIGLYRQASQQRKSPKAEVKALAAPLDLTVPAEAHEAPVLLDSDRDGEESVARPLSCKQLKIACVMDEFTFGSYSPEANLLQLTPGNWHAELESFVPEMLFIESAWRGKDELWGSKVGHNASELQQIVRWCKQRQVPTVFWNKEDPVHFETFLTTAKQFDHVFTTDFDCIHRYKAALGHARVYFLPFACQPVVHNPIERYERKDAFCFAGAYYVRYPERTRDLGNFMSQLTRFRPVEIYDRNFGKNDPSYQFPAEYQPFIVGTLKSSEIDRAYKGYNYAINMNSVKQSQTMFARRVYELLGCNTLTVSNYSRGMRLMFGDLVITTDSGEQMLARLEQLAIDAEGSDKLRLAALRKVMLEHTYGQRLDYVLSKVTGNAQVHDLPSIAVLASARSRAQLEQLLTCFSAQTLAGRTLHVLIPDDVEVAEAPERVSLIRARDAAGLTVAQVIGDAGWVAGMVVEDYYGPNYLLDLSLATRYSQALAFGKVEHFQGEASAIQLRNQGRAYHKSTSLALRSSLVSAPVVHAADFMSWVRELSTQSLDEGRMLAVDRFNYCRDVAGVLPTSVTARVDDLRLDTGLSIQALQQAAEAIEPAQEATQALKLEIDQLVETFGPCQSKHVSFTREEHGWLVSSSLSDGKHEYVYAANDLPVAQLGDVQKLHVEVTPGLNIQLVMLFMDANDQRISHVMLPANRNHTIDVPPETAFVRLGWRIYAAGVAEIKSVIRGHRDVLPARIISPAEHLVLTNNYPAYHDLYRNGFVHTRVQGYAAVGVRTDVLRFREKELGGYEEFQGQDVFTGGAQLLEKMLASGQYKTVLVHFLSPSMWQVLSKFVDSVKVLIWLHGAEIHPWHRREFNYLSDTQRELAKVDSEKRMAFWQQVLVPMHANVHLVIVSQAFAKEIMEDTGVALSAAQYSVIHNPIDVQRFNFVEKPAEQRKKVLSIRPFASRQYANDLSVQAIVELSRCSAFEEVEFRIIGDGILFDELVEPLRQFANVVIEKRFLTHQQIAELHKQYGIFLCPTRWDSQGVSRDEAMSSGLVPVTTAVAAVPEFADEQCAALVPAEDPVALAQALELLINDEQLFLSKSRNAAERVRAQSAISHVIAQELRLFEQGSIRQ